MAECARTTLRPEVLAGPGLFGGLFALKGFKQAVLVSSADGVGSKLKIASALDRHDTIGVDLVNHCVNDISTCGAEPLFFLDYIAMGKLIPERVESIVRGIAKACSDVGCSLIGGETAEMPGLYAGDDYDLVGFIVGGIEKERIINGSTISAGDAIIGLAASGLHTNGYSLVRKILGTTKQALDTLYPELGRTLGEELLEPHRLYYHQLKPVLNLIKGMAHITGGGLIGNVPRVLPDGVAAKISTKSWSALPIFRLTQQRGKVDRDEMYSVFNMGIGMVVICSPENVDQIKKSLPETNVIGKVEKQRNKTRVVID
ncbi:MAG: phosphoribosylformylglycinamidine cyclo-ligase [Dehalococcoidales bacterium]